MLGCGQCGQNHSLLCMLQPQSTATTLLYIDVGMEPERLAAAYWHGGALRLVLMVTSSFMKVAAILPSSLNSIAC